MKNFILFNKIKKYIYICAAIINVCVCVCMKIKKKKYECGNMCMYYYYI